MGVASKVCNVIGRVGELICASVVCGIQGYYLHLLASAGDAYNSPRFIYAVVLAGISILCSIVLMPPFKHAFAAFPLDFALFICWMVCFGLMVNLTAGDGCDSYWLWHDWGFYWGRWWNVVPYNRQSAAIVTTTYCANWQTSLAFEFIGGLLWLANGALGVYAMMAGRRESRENLERRQQQDNLEEAGLASAPSIEKTSAP